MADTVWWSRRSKTIRLMGRWNGGHDGEAIYYSSMLVTFKWPKPGDAATALLSVLLSIRYITSRSIQISRAFLSCVLVHRAFEMCQVALPS